MKKRLIIIGGVLMALTVSLLAWTQNGTSGKQLPLTMENLETLALDTDTEIGGFWRQGMRAGSIVLEQKGPDGKWYKVTIYCCVGATENDACNASTDC